MSKFVTTFSFVVVLAFGSLVFAQRQTGSITGTVSDETGAVLPGVTVTLTSEALIAGTSVATTDQTGAYNFSSLPPGIYDATFELPGFASMRQEAIRISAFFVATVNAVLSVGGVEETITVTGESPVVDVKSNVITTEVDRDILDHVPSGRDIWVIAEQVPGVVQNKYNVGGTESAQQSASYLHGAYAQVRYAFDGLSNNWPGSTGSWVMFYYDYDSFEEVQVVTSGAPAEVGVGGMYLNLVSKSGGNDFHGSTTFLYTPGSWQGDNLSAEHEALGLTAANRVDHILNFVPTLGGPIIREKMWFFGSYTRYDVNTEVPGYTKPDGSPELDVNHQTNTMAKVTAQLNPANKLMGMFYFNYQNRFFRRSGAVNFVSEEASMRQIQPGYLYQGQWTSVLPNDLVLDARAGFATHVHPLLNQPTADPNAIARVDTVLSTLTEASDYYHRHQSPRTQIDASLSGFATNVLGGTHDWKIGMSHTRAETYYDQWVNGDYVRFFENGVPDHVELYARIGEVDNWGNEGKFSNYHEWAFFIQDSFTIGERVTINPGIRFETFRGFYPAQSRLASQYFPDVFPAAEFPGRDDIPNWFNVVPRFGISIDASGDGRTAIHAGINKYTQSMAGLFPQTLNPNSQIWEYKPWTDLNGNELAESNEMGPTISRGGGVGIDIDPDITRELSYEVTAGIEHQLGADLSIAATYHYRHNYNFMGRLNRAAPTSAFTPVNAVTPEGQTITVYDQDPATLGQVDRIITNFPEFYENYHGVEITGRKRFTNNWQLLAGYTWGRHKGNRGMSGTVINRDLNDPNNLVNAEDSYHFQDRTHIIKMNTSYFFPRKFSVSANYRYYTGQPFARQFRVALNQGRVTVPAEPLGTFRYPNVSILDLRFSKIFEFDNWNLEGIFQLFNAFNSDAVVNQVTVLGPAYGTPSKLLTPIVAGFGIRLTF